MEFIVRAIKIIQELNQILQLVKIKNQELKLIMVQI